MTKLQKNNDSPIRLCATLLYTHLHQSPFSMTDPYVYRAARQPELFSMIDPFIEKLLFYYRVQTLYRAAPPLDLDDQSLPVTARPGQAVEPPAARLSPHQHFGFGGKGPYFQLLHYRYLHTSPRATKRFQKKSPARSSGRTPGSPA